MFLFQFVLECLLKGLSLCVCPTDSGGIVQLLSVLALHAFWSLWSAILPWLYVWCVICQWGYHLPFSLSYYCTMGPQSTIFSMNCYSRPYWNKHNFCTYHGSYHFLFVFWLMLHNVHHHYLHQLVVYYLLAWCLLLGN